MEIEPQYPVPQHMNEPLDFKFRFYMPSLHHLEQMVCALSKQFKVYRDAGRQAEAQGEHKIVCDMVHAQAEQVMYLLQQLLANLPPEHKTRLTIMASTTINPARNPAVQNPAGAQESAEKPSSASVSDRPSE